MTRPISVLLVEDDEDDQILTRALLAELGDIDGSEYVLTWVRSVEEGLQRLIDEPFDVCLLDYALGERTGLELLSSAVALGIEVPIIFLTGQTGRALDLEATRIGAADYLVKGRIHADVLERSIRYSIARGHSLSTLRQLNRELERTRNQAILANRAKSAFLTSVSHAYRESLDEILGAAEALKGLGDGPAGAHVQTIRDAGGRLKGMLAEVLAMSDPPIGAAVLELRRVEVEPFVREIVAAIRPLVGHNNNTFELSCGPDVGAIETDAGQLGRVLLNLLGNVCKFTRRGRILLEVTRCRDGELELAIRPSGLWLAPEQLELLFANLSHADVGEGPRDGADESGLANSRRICRRLGGNLVVEMDGPRRPVLRVRVPGRVAA